MPPPWSETIHATPHATAGDLAQCRAMLRGGSRSFSAASHLLPKSVRDPAIALYAFCRLADDAIDLGGGSQDAVAMLRQRLESAYAGRPMDHPADRALADVVQRFAIPRTLPETLLEGFAWDASGRRYYDIADLTAYAVRVAGTVGAMMAIIMGVRAPDAVARACDLGVAMQLSNIARDVGEDAGMGRLYLPERWMIEAGIDPDAWLARPVFSAELGRVVQRLLKHADILYTQADAGIHQLPSSCRPGIGAARALYAEIGYEVARRGCNSVSVRAVMPAHRKAWALTGGLVALVKIGRAASFPPLKEAQFLVDAVAAMPDRPEAQPRRTLPPLHTDGRLAWLIDLFADLERRELTRRQSS